jgi:hypothetical protein
VAYGKQDLAERIVQEAPDLLQIEGTATDYSGLTFKKSTAYEYAWWAKDTHLRRMLEAHMDADTKAYLLVRIDACVANGLTYTEANRDVVRTDDLMQSHKNLEAPAPSLGMSR